MFRFSRHLQYIYHFQLIHLLICIILLLVVSVILSLSLIKDCQKRSRIQSPQRADLCALCSLVARHSPRISSRIFPWTRFTRLIFRQAFPVSLPTVRSRSYRGVATPVTVARTIASLLTYKRNCSRYHAIAQNDRKPLFSSGKEEAVAISRVYFVADGTKSVGLLSEINRPMPRTILESGSRRGPAFSASHFRRVAPRSSLSRASRLDLGPSHAPPTPRGSSSFPRVELNST